jgi:hypothetical protein
VLDDAVLDDAVLDDAVLDDAVLDDAVLDDAVLDDAVLGIRTDTGPRSQGSWMTSPGKIAWLMPSLQPLASAIACAVVSNLAAIPER